MVPPLSNNLPSSISRLACLAFLFSMFSMRVNGEEFNDAIRAYLQNCIEPATAKIGFVVGIVNENGARLVSYGKLDNGTDQEVNGDTVFEIGSDTKTFTALLLQDMVDRGEMKLDDPVAHYLPEAVTMPIRNGKE